MGKKTTFSSEARKGALRGVIPALPSSGNRLRVETSVSLRKRKKTESPGQ